MCELCKAMPRPQVEQEWFAAIGIVQGKDQADMTPAEWGQVEEHIRAKYGSPDGAPPMTPTSAENTADRPAAKPAGAEAADDDSVPF